MDMMGSAQTQRDIPQIKIIRYYQFLEEGRHDKHANGQKNKQAVGADLIAIEILLKMPDATDNHGNTRNEREVKHHGACQALIYEHASKL